MVFLIFSEGIKTLQTAAAFFINPCEPPNRCGSNQGGTIFKCRLHQMPKGRFVQKTALEKVQEPRPPSVIMTSEFLCGVGGDLPK